MQQVVRSYGFSYYSLFSREVLKTEVRWHPLLRHFELNPDEPAKSDFRSGLDTGWTAMEIAEEPFYWQDMLKAADGNTRIKRRILHYLSLAAKMNIDHTVSHFQFIPKAALSGVMMVALDRPIELSPVELALFETLSTSLLRRCRRILQCDNATRDAVQNVPELSSREIEILQNLTEGMTSIEAGKTMGLSNHTVDWYVSSLQEKLGARNRQNLIAMAFRLGLVK